VDVFVGRFGRQASATMMHMSFYWGYDVTVLFKSWTISSAQAYFLTWFLVFLFGLLHEFLVTYRTTYIQKHLAIRGPAPEEGVRVPMLEKKSPAAPGSSKVVSTVLYGVNHITGYSLMLIVMTFNLGLFVAVILGLSVGFLFFGLSRGATFPPEGDLHC